MRLLALIIAIIGLILTIALTILPTGSLAIFPALVTIVCGFILLRLYKQENKPTKLPKIIIAIALACSAFAITKTIVTEDTIEIDTELQQREKESKNDAIKDLEDLE